MWRMVTVLAVFVIVFFGLAVFVDDASPEKRLVVSTAIIGALLAAILAALVVPG